MKSFLRAILSLLTVAVAVVAIALAIAGVYYALGDVSGERALKLVFYIGGAGLLVFSLLTHGSERKAWSSAADSFVEHLVDVPPDERITVNPTAAFMLGAIALLALGIAVEAFL